MNIPVLALGFRPFYLLAGIFAAIALPVWMAVFFGYIQLPGYLSGLDWHSHEMIFGFAPAVIAGFLLTAVRNWTGLPTASGAALAGLAGLWLAGRVLVITGPVAPAMVVDLLFLPVLGVTLAMPILASRNLRNLKVLAILAVLAILNLGYHAAHMNFLPFEFKRIAVTAALDVITILMAVIAGRVIPAFTRGAIAEASVHRSLAVEVLAFGSLVAVLIMDIMGFWFSIPPVFWLVVLITAAVAHGVRLALWKPQQTVSNPLLLMLPVAYAWIPIALVLRTMAQLDLVPVAAATHALTIGAMSSLMIAMMTRSALGHTGRTLQAGAVELTAFMLLQFAAVVRTLAGVVLPGQYRAAMILAALLWFLAFAVFLVGYAPILTQKRIDDRPG